MAKSTESANVVLDYLLRGSAYPTKYLALFSDTDALTEVALTRVASPAWSAAASGSSHTLADADFEEAAAPLTVRSWALMSAAVSGIRLYYDLTRNGSGVPVVHSITAGTPCSFAAGALIIAES